MAITYVIKFLKISFSLINFTLFSPTILHFYLFENFQGSFLNDYLFDQQDIDMASEIR